MAGLTICMSAAKIADNLLFSNFVILSESDKKYSDPIWEVVQKEHGINCTPGGSAKCLLPGEENPEGTEGD